MEADEEFTEDEEDLDIDIDDRDIEDIEDD